MGRALLCAGLVLSACDGGSEPAGSTSAATEPGVGAARTSPRAQLLHDVDRRVLTPRWEAALRASDPTLRATAMRGVGVLQPEQADPWLLRGLRDGEPRVRSWAGFAIGAREGEVTPNLRRALLGAMAAEASEEVRAHLLWDLGRCGGPDALPPFRSALLADSERERAASCEAMAHMGLRGRALPGDLMRQVATHMVEDPDPGVRAACAHAVSRAMEARAVVPDLRLALQDQEPEVRLHALRALGRYPDVEPEPLMRAAAEATTHVAVQAVRALGQRAARGDAGPLAQALRMGLERLLDGTGALDAGQLQFVLVALDAARPAVTEPPILAAIEHGRDRLGPVEPSVEGRARLDCALARALDLAHGWPRDVKTCGDDSVSAAWRDRAAAEILGQGAGAEAERFAYLKRLHRRGDTRTRQAVLEAIPAVAHPGLMTLVVQGLSSGDRGLVATAARALATPGPLREVAPDPSPELLRAMAKARALLEEEAYPAGLAAWCRAAAVVGETDLLERPDFLLTHPSRTVRSAAGEARRRLGLPARSPAPRAPEDTLSAETFQSVEQHTRAVLVTARGPIELVLWPNRAPATVARFVQLASAGFHDGTTFHWVRPGFAVQGGDPRGDGHGGPEFVVWDEPHRTPFRRGTLGMAHAGPDTAGSQFFITLAPAPQLTGRYTAFGRVTRGLDLLDALRENDPLQHLTVSRETP
jgi:cyclophilin family peptidyl-prolyl cis-trans isomerase/HEAT repeat protein